MREDGEIREDRESRCFECGEPADKLILGTAFCRLCAEVVQRELAEEDDAHKARCLNQ